MAAPHKTYALNLGMQTVALAEFEILPNGGLVLSAYHKTELMVDPAADITRREQIAKAVADLRQAMGLRTIPEAGICLPSQAVFSRFVKLPGATAEDVRAIIGFEAQQNVPFPISDVTWDWQILGGERDGNWDVALVAIKSDQLQELFDACKQGGVIGSIVDVASFALYNAFRYNYSELTGTTLLIDIGARTTNLVFIDGEKVFSRAIPIGGCAISTNIGKEIDREITAAEILKIEKGFVALGGAYAEPDDPIIAKISKVARNTMTKLHAEIARSISFYRANQGGKQPLRAFLCGGAVSMPYMLEFFSEKLQMPIEFFNPLRNVILKNADVGEAVRSKIHTVGELVGLATRALGNCPIEIDLRPASAIRDADTKRRLPELISALVCLLLAVVSFLLYFQKVKSLYQQAAAGVAADVGKLKSIAADIQKSKTELAGLEALAAPLALIAEERAYWITVLNALSESLPPRNIWITEMTPLSGGAPVQIQAANPLAVTPGQGGGAGRRPDLSAPRRPGASDNQGIAAAPKTIDALRIDGLYLETGEGPQVVDKFIDQLSKSPLFAIDADVRTRMVRTQPDGSSWAYPYSITVPLKQTIRLQ